MKGQIFLGAFESATCAMGPGLRACIWVRGCPMRCRECATPEFLEFPEGHPYHAVIARNGAQRSDEAIPRPLRAGLPRPDAVGARNDLVSAREICSWLDRAIADRNITGVSFSGGEPFAQSVALAAVARYARSRGLSTLSWSGFSRAHLEGSRAPDGAQELLAQLDVLIDGPFVACRANGDPLRGSSNQRIHLLTDRHQPEEFEGSIVEVVLNADGASVTTGVMDYAATDAILAMLGVS